MAPSSTIAAKHRTPRASRGRTSEASRAMAASISAARSRWISSTGKRCLSPSPRPSPRWGEGEPNCGSSPRWGEGGPSGRSAAQRVLLICALEAEVQLPDVLDHLFVAARRAAREALEERKHGVGRVVEVDQRVAPFEVAALRLGRPLAVVDGGAPLAAPRSVDLDAIGI